TFGAAGEDRLAVRADGHLVAETSNDAEFAAGGRIPPAHGAVPTRGDGRLAVRTQGYSDHARDMAGQRAEVLAGGRFPQADHAAPPRRHDRSAVARPGKHFDLRVL